MPPQMPNATAHFSSFNMEEQVRRLRFEPALEARYRRYVETSNRPSVITAGLVVFAIWISFAILDLVRITSLVAVEADALILVWIVVRFGTLIFISVVGILVARGMQNYGSLVALCYLAIGWSVSVASAIAIFKHSFAADSSQLVVIMSGFLPLGLTFFRALAASSAVAAVAAVVTLLNVPERGLAMQSQLAIMVVVALAVAAAGGYHRERSDRRQFALGLMLDDLASTDPLTGLANRRKFFGHLATTAAQAQRDETSVYVAVVDVDHFKSFNDTYGHVAGDMALEQFGRVLSASVRRPLDLAARYGGEEFVLVYYGADEAGVLARLSSALQALRDHRISHSGASGGTLTASVGYTLLRDGEDAMSVLARADKALYAAKAAGRDTVCAA